MNLKTALNLGTTLAAALVLSAATGCASHGPSDGRPPVDTLIEGNEGLQAKDVGAATDKMVADLLALPELNASAKKWTVVITAVENKTTDPTFSYDVFSQRLKARVSQLGRGRVAIIDNKAHFHDLQNSELEGGGGDTFGQGGGGRAMPAGIQPDYGLSIRIDQMPNRVTDYFLIVATLNNTQTRESVWVSPQYEVQVAR